MNNKSKAPNFLGLIDENNHIGLDDYKGSFLVIYFYPKDKTSGCTLESQDFRDYKKKFAEYIETNENEINSRTRTLYTNEHLHDQ